MKFSNLNLVMALAILALSLVSQQLYSQTCVSCDDNKSNVTIGYNNDVNNDWEEQSILGNNNTTSRNNAVAIGTNSNANWSHSYVFGSSSSSNGIHSYAIGSNAIAQSSYSYAIGQAAKSMFGNAFAVGNFTLSNAVGAYVFGLGVSSEIPFENNNQNSLAIGFLSTKPTIFVSESPFSANYDRTGRIGIGNVIDPQTKLHIRGDTGEDADLLLEPGDENQTALIRLGQNNSISAKDGGNMLFETETGQAFVFENGNMGIGTNAPTAKLQVMGNMNVGNNPNDTIGLNAFVGGEENKASGQSAFSYGKLNNAGGVFSVALGRESNAMGHAAIALGYNAEAKAANTVAIGKFVQASSSSAMVLGTGTSTEMLKNGIVHSLMIGFNSNLPTVFISSSDGVGTTGNVGIGTSQPEAKLHISGDLQVGDTSQPQNVRIYGGINGSGDYASSFGDGNTASGNYSFVAGRNSQIISTTQFASHYSNIIGSWSSIEKGPHSNVIGSFSQAMNDFSFTFGTYNKAKGSYSFAIGSHVEAWSGGSFVIGSGLIDAKLINSVPNSLMIGFNSAFPTLFVSRTQLDFQSGRVGIGNITDPQAKLHIRADAEEDATIMLESTGTGKHARMFFTGEHHITASNGDDFKFRTTDESNFVFQNGDIFMEDINTGIIMKSPNGQCWRGTMTDQGSLSFEQATCPDGEASSLGQVQQQGSMKVYPNPAGNSLIVETAKSSTEGYLLVSSTDGIQMGRHRILSDKTNLNLSWFVAGTYLIQLELNGQIVESTKFVKQ